MTDREPAAPPRHCMVVHAYYPLAETRRAARSRGVGPRRLRGRRRVPARRRRARTRALSRRRDPSAAMSSSTSGDSAHQFSSYVRFGARATAKVATLHRRHRYRSVQVHNLPDFLVFCALGPKLHRVPVILDLHDLMPEFFAGRFSGRRQMLGRLVRAQEQLACRFSDHVITVSEHWRETLIARGVRPDKCSVVMNVADERIFKPAAAPSAQRFDVLSRVPRHRDASVRPRSRGARGGAASRGDTGCAVDDPRQG